MGRMPYIRYPYPFVVRPDLEGWSFYMNRQEERQTEQEIREKEDRELKEYGQMTLEENGKKRKIHLLSIIGEVEGHENSPGSSKSTRYDHVLPRLARLKMTTALTECWFF